VAHDVEESQSLSSSIQRTASPTKSNEAFAEASWLIFVLTFSNLAPPKYHSKLKIRGGAWLLRETGISEDFFVVHFKH